MKALLTLAAGVAITAISGYSFMAARATESTGLAALGFIGIVAGIITAIAGLVTNHHDHTRRK